MSHGHSQYGRNIPYGKEYRSTTFVSRPYVTEVLPSPNTVNVKKSVDIEFTIADNYTKVLLPSIQIWVRGVLVFNANGFLADWTTSEFSIKNLGFKFRITPNTALKWVAEERITVRVRATNSNLEVLDTSWYFDIIKRIVTLKVYNMIIKGVRDTDEDNT